MRQNSIVIGILIIASATCLSAQSFSFYSTLQAGQNASASWEVGTGTTPAYSNATWTVADFYYNSVPSDNHWRSGGLTQEFQVGYNATTNTAFTRVKDFQGNWTEAARANPGPALTTDAIWTLPASSFNLSATGLPTPNLIIIEGLAISPNVTLVSGTLPASLGAFGSPGNSSVSNLSAPLVINAAANGGSWYLGGTVRFSGLLGSGGSAQGSQLSFNLQATGNQTPEATTMSLLGGGLAFLGWMSRRRRMGGVK